MLLADLPKVDDAVVRLSSYRGSARSDTAEQQGLAVSTARADGLLPHLAIGRKADEGVTEGPCGHARAVDEGTPWQSMPEELFEQVNALENGYAVTLLYRDDVPAPDDEGDDDER
jgi:hypothetical protein